MMMAGFMAITAFLSMWISNTATTSMMTPLVLAVLGQLSKTGATKNSDPLAVQEEAHGAEHIDEPVALDHDHADFDQMTQHSADDNASDLDLMSATGQHSQIGPTSEGFSEDHLRFSKASLLGIAYAASIGGTATLVGTGTNVILVQAFSKLFPGAPNISFGGWFLFASPLALLLLVVAFGLLAVMFTRNTKVTVEKSHLEAEHEKVGPFRFAQVVLLLDLVFMVVCWFLRPILEEEKLLRPGYITDGTISMAAALVLFVIPSRQATPPGTSVESPVAVLDGGDRVVDENGKEKKTCRLADNETLLDVPWDIVMLLGGGLALAEGFQASGLSLVLAHKLNILSNLPLYIMISLISLVVLFTTELTSNIATVTLVLPILAAMAQSTHEHPLLLMIPATICCSLAFMLPVATPPNAIVFAANKLKVADMAKAGFLLNILSLLLVPAYMISLGKVIFGIDFHQFPSWAIPQDTPGIQEEPEFAPFSNTTSPF